MLAGASVSPLSLIGSDWCHCEITIKKLPVIDLLVLVGANAWFNRAVREERFFR